MKNERKNILNELKQNKIDELQALKKMLLAIENEQLHKNKQTHEKLKNTKNDE